MKEYKYDKEEKVDIDSETISKYKDFGKLEANYQRALKDLHKKPLYRNPKVFLSIVMILLVAYLVWKSSEIPPKPMPENSIDQIIDE